MTSRSSLLGMAVTAGSLVLSTWAMYHLMRTGTCASGGPYAIARPCPPGTGWHMLALMGGIFAALGGAVVAKSPSLGILWFGLFFTLSGAVSILINVGPAAPPDSGSGGIIMGVAFIAVLGVGPIWVALATAGKKP